MKTVITLIFVACSTFFAHAQTFLASLQQQYKGMGKVLVIQTKEIDDLVNGVLRNNDKRGSSPTVKVVTPNPIPSEKNKTNKVEVKTTGSGTVTDKTHLSVKINEREKESGNSRETKKIESRKEEAGESPIVDTSKKVMRRSYKVSGYRVQAFAGGNTRVDRQQAQQIGEAIKRKYPDLPVYVHFYSPRWICRIGNFRSYQEAKEVLKGVRDMGYRSATIVKGMITVQY